MAPTVDKQRRNSATIDITLLQMIETNSDEEETTSNLNKQYNIPRILVSTITTSIGSFFYGYEIVVFSSIQESMAKTLNWKKEDKSFYISNIASMMIFGALVGSMISGKIISQFGRRKSTILFDLVSLIGIGLTILPHEIPIIFGRFFCGFCIGGFTVLVPLKIYEEVPREYNNCCSAIYGLILGIGITISYSLGIFNTPEREEYWWKVMFAFPAVFIFLNMFLVIFIFKYDTPKYIYLYQRNKDLAVFILNLTFLTPEDVTFQIQDLEKLSLSSLNKTETSYFDILCSKTYRNLFICGFALTLVTDWMGLGFVAGYSFFIMNILSNGDGPQARLLVSLLGCCELISKVFSIPLFLKIGKKKPLLVGLIGSFLVLTSTSICFYLKLSVPQKILLMFLPIFYGLLLSPAVYSTIPELLPDKGVGILICINFFSQMVSVKMFPYLFQLTFIRIEGVFMIYAILVFCLITVICLKYKETTGLTMNQVIKKYNESNSNSQF